VWKRGVFDIFLKLSELGIGSGTGDPEFCSIDGSIQSFLCFLTLYYIKFHFISLISIHVMLLVSTASVLYIRTLNFAR
jgi:hypothetical protein